MNDNVTTIFISAAEVSGDMHAAKLIRQLKALDPSLRCVGLGGPAMAEAGCELLENLVSRSAMLTHAVSQVGFYWKLLKRVKRYFRENSIQTVVLVDSPAWNFHVAKAAKKQGVRTVYYIAPQLWAWGRWRIGKLRRSVDKVACILPFEEKWFKDRGLDAEYVGHPLFDRLSDNCHRTRLDWAQGQQPRVVLLPGSRSHEIEKLWPEMLKVADQIRRQFAHASIIAVAKDADTADQLRQSSPAELELKVHCCSVREACREADLALVASGTATLEVAGANCPMIIMYDISSWQWHLVGRWLIKTPYLSLVNILAQRELVPEFMPVLPKTEVLAETALGLLGDEQARQKMRDELAKLMSSMIHSGAAKRAAQIVLNSRQ